MSSLRSLVFRTGLLALAVAGCNSILDNKPGTLRQNPTPTDVEQNQPEQQQPEVPSIVGASSSGGDPYATPPPASTPPPPAPPSASGDCTDGKVLCGGQCVSKDDPAYGCGAADCKPCAIAHGSAACAGGACAVKACDRGYSDCNAKPADGCETDLSKAASCGSCNAVCPPATPVCAPHLDSFQCGTGCTPAAPLLCGSECVDPLTSKNHCGGCGRKCPDVPDGETTCTAGQCGFTCHPTFHACAGRCAPANDVTACGPSCTLCPAPPNATASCVSDACSFVCAAGHADCNAKPGDGCETALMTDPLNCGACGKSCNGGECTNGVCGPPPDPDAGAPPPP